MMDTRRVTAVNRNMFYNRSLRYSLRAVLANKVTGVHLSCTIGVHDCVAYHDSACLAEI